MGIYATWMHSTTFFTSGTCTNASATSVATPRGKIVPTIDTILLKNGSFERFGEGNFKIYLILDFFFRFFFNIISNGQNMFTSSFIY
jgi:hypothetical protein